MEEQRDLLLCKVQHLEGELKDISQKYADLAGHQNNKQKIKHLSDLKHKNEEISQVFWNLLNIFYINSSINVPSAIDHK